MCPAAGFEVFGRRYNASIPMLRIRVITADRDPQEIPQHPAGRRRAER